jgi:hypothetical protein
VHKLFADWYRQVDLSISADGLNRRWGCIEAALRKLDANAVMQLTRVSFALHKPDSAGGDVDGAAVALTFKEADVSFPMKGNDQLLRVLFGVTLAQAIEEKHALATFAALAVTSARCSGLVAAPPIEELPAIAERHLTIEGGSRRSNALQDPVVTPKFGKVDVTQPGIVDIQDTQNQNHWAQVHQNFQNLKIWASQVNATLEALAAANSKTRTETITAFKANAERAALEERIKVLKEEANVLWWLFGEYSSTVQKAWSDGTAGEFCIALGRELADLLAFYEPTTNIASFLSKALSRSAEAGDMLTVKQVLDSGSGEWRGAVAKSIRELVQRSGAISPLHTGLVARVDASSRWVERLIEVTALKPDSQLLPLEWALQACREALLLRWMENKGG